MSIRRKQLPYPQNGSNLTFEIFSVLMNYILTPMDKVRSVLSDIDPIVH